MFSWNQYEFIECLAVLPEIDEEYETNYVFRVEKDGLALTLTIYQDSGDVYFYLERDGIEEPVFRMQLMDCPGARYVSTKEGKEYLEFAATKSLGSRFDGEYSIPTGVRLSVSSHISIELF